MTHPILRENTKSTLVTPHRRKGNEVRFPKQTDYKILEKNKAKSKINIDTEFKSGQKRLSK